MEVVSLFLIVTVILWFVFGHLFDRKEYKHFKGRIGRKAIEVGHVKGEQSISQLKEQSKDEVQDNGDLNAQSKAEINGGSKD